MLAQQSEVTRLSLPVQERELQASINPDNTIDLAIFRHTDLEEITLNREQVEELIRFLGRWLRS
jgi:hypothetical protein